MSAVRAEGLKKTFRDRKGDVHAIAGVDLTVQEGELLVLVGPSGCGKTTLLRCLSGLEHATEGRVTIGAQVVFDAKQGVYVPPNKRDIGMVFQKYALWPHMTVRRNVEYPLRARRKKADLHGDRVAQALDSVQCAMLADRIPGELSGGQQQRVALARAIVSNPAVLFLDEPLSNLDALLRLQLREELRLLHRAIKFTGVYVTHDQSEALSLGDRVAVMRAGRIEQLAEPAEVYDRPATPEVAAFLGIRNSFVTRLVDGQWRTDVGPMAGFEPATTGGEYEVFVRPEDIVLREAGAGVQDEVGRNGWSVGVGTVEETLFGGNVIEYVVTVGGQRVAAIAARGRFGCQRGEQVEVIVPPERALVYEDGAIVSPRPHTSRPRLVPREVAVQPAPDTPLRDTAMPGL